MNNNQGSTTPCEGASCSIASGEMRMPMEGVAHQVARHYNEQGEKTLEDRKRSNIITLKNYNNWVKSMHFNMTMEYFRQQNVPHNSLIGLDLCCGKGGDLRKWGQSNMMKHVVFVDIAEESVKICEERYKTMLKNSRKSQRDSPHFTAEFIVADCAKESLRTKFFDPNMQFDVVSCQFAFHYCFETFHQAQQMLRNATENLKKGGYFFGTLPNADRIVKRCRESGKANAFANKICKIRFECEEPYPLFGARYFFDLIESVACPEFLVQFPTLKALASKFNLSLLYRTPFDVFHRLQESNPQGKILLGLMGAMETYPPFSGKSPNFPENYYNHASKVMNKNVRVGTISSVEWEVIRLYLAFCFRKD